MYLMNITKNEPNRARADLVTKKLRQFLYQNKLQALIIFFFTNKCFPDSCILFAFFVDSKTKKSK